MAQTNKESSVSNPTTIVYTAFAVAAVLLLIIAKFGILPIPTKNITETTAIAGMAAMFLGFAGYNEYLNWFPGRNWLFHILIGAGCIGFFYLFLTTPFVAP